MKRYIDKNGREIKVGTKISIEGGKSQEVYAIEDSHGKEGLGINASNPAYLKAHPDQEQEFYPLTEFNHVSTLGGVIQMTTTVVVGEKK